MEGEIDQQLAPQYMMAPRSDKADLLDKIRPDEIVEILRHKLMGEDFIEGKWKKNPALITTIKVDGKKVEISRALTAVGAWELSNLMLPVSSQNVALSDLKDKEIRARTLSIVDTAMEMCLMNWKDYGIKGADQIRFVHELILSNTFITLKQPENNGIRKLIGNTTTEMRSFSNVDHSRPSFVSSLFRTRQR